MNCNAARLSCSFAGYVQSGLFYFDLTGSGANLTQIYPPSTASEGTANCLTGSMNNNTACYGEFPIIFPNGDHLFMLFIGTTTTPALLINECAAAPASSCKVQFPSETLMMDLGTNTQNPNPGAIIQQTNFQLPGSGLNTTFLNGGIPSGHYGNWAIANDSFQLEVPGVYFVPHDDHK